MLSTGVLAGSLFNQRGFEIEIGNFSRKYCDASETRFVWLYDLSDVTISKENH